MKYGKKRGGANDWTLQGLLGSLQGFVGAPGTNSQYNVAVITIIMHIFLAIAIILMFMKKELYFLLVIVFLVIIVFKSGFMLLGGLIGQGITILSNVRASPDPLTDGINAFAFLAVITGMCMEIISVSLMIAGFEQSRRAFRTVIGRISNAYEPLVRDFRWYFIGVTGLTLILAFLLVIRPTGLDETDNSIAFSNLILSFGSLTMAVLCGYLFLAAYNFYKKARHKQVFSVPDTDANGGRAPLKTQAPNIRKNGYGLGYEDVELTAAPTPNVKQATTPPANECL